MIFLDPSVAAKLVILVILLLLSALFSSAETSLTTVSKLRIRSLHEDGVKRAGTALKLIEEPSNMLSAILIGNNIVNLSASSLATSVALDQLEKDILQIDDADNIISCAGVNRKTGIFVCAEGFHQLGIAHFCVGERHVDAWYHNATSSGAAVLPLQPVSSRCSC